MGAIRYGFRTPERFPRLKTVHIYLLNTPKRELDFDPAGRRYRRRGMVYPIAGGQGCFSPQLKAHDMSNSGPVWNLVD